MEFQQYPLAMKHPQHRPAVLSQDKVNRDGTISKASPGMPESYPDVFVNNKDQELLYASKGYMPNGVSDPKAYMSSVLGADTPFSYDHVEYPKWVYQIDAEGDVESKLVNDKSSEDKLKGKWHATPDIAWQAAEAEDTAPSTDVKRGPGCPKNEQTEVRS